MSDLSPLIPRGRGNAYRGIGEVVYRNLESLLPSIEKLEPMERMLILQYVQELFAIEAEGDNE